MEAVAPECLTPEESNMQGCDGPADKAGNTGSHPRGPKVQVGGKQPGIGFNLFFKQLKSRLLVILV